MLHLSIPMKLHLLHEVLTDTGGETALASIAVIGRSLCTYSDGTNWILGHGGCYMDTETFFKCLCCLETSITWNSYQFYKSHHRYYIQSAARSQTAVWGLQWLGRSCSISLVTHSSCFVIRGRLRFMGKSPLAKLEEIASFPSFNQNCWPGTPISALVFYGTLSCHSDLARWNMTRQQRLVYGPNLQELGNEGNNWTPQSLASEQSQQEI